MIERDVISVLKDNSKNIIALCNNRQLLSPQFKNDIIKDIESGHIKYYIDSEGRGKVLINIVVEDGRKLLKENLIEQ